MPNPIGTNQAATSGQTPVHQHGGDAAAVARSLGIDVTDLLDLSASLNPFAPDVAVLAKRHVNALVPYPDDHAATVQLATALDVARERVVLTNGGSEAIALVASIVQSGHIVDPEFSLYRRHLSEVNGSSGRWRSNPSNPLGELAAAHERAAVWDEAFYPLATGQWTRRDESSWRLGSLTKLWSCAGLRLGYVIAPTIAAADIVRMRKPRWSVNGLALSLMGDLLEQTDLVAWSNQIRELGQTFADELGALGYASATTTVNWVLIDVGKSANALLLRDRLLEDRILIRDCANFGMPGIVRVALPHPIHLDRTLSAFARCAQVVAEP